MKTTNYARLGGAVVSAVLLMAGGLARAGDFTWTFETDPATGTNPLSLGGNNNEMWRSLPGEGNGSDGFLALTYPVGDQRGYALFPDIDAGKFIVSFELTADIRSGNSTGDRAADGWSVSLAREGDAALTNPGDMASFGGAYEFGTQTGIAISFDTWSGNTFPDGSGDIEGLIVRVDGKTVKTVGLPTRHGLCADNTSLQTGPRDPDYWAASGDPYEPGSWSLLCWQQLRVVVDEQGRVSVYWKGRTILENEPTEFFPSAGRIVLAARTGGANSNVHFDNLKLVTTAVDPETEPPTDPGSLTIPEVGAARVVLVWGESTDNSGRVGYEIERNGTVLPGVKTATTWTDGGVLPQTTYAYRVRATDVAGNKSAWVPNTPLAVTTAAEVPAKGFVKGTIYDGIDGAIPILTAIQDPIYTSGAFTRVAYFPGIDFNGFGDNYLIDIEATLTPQVSGQYRFFVRSDDASELFLNTTGPEIPDPNQVNPIAAESDCCDAFQEPGVANDDGTTFPTSDPIQLTAGQAYGFRFLVKEGGGGDWGQVAWRLEGDTTPAANLTPIRGLVLNGQADPVGSTLTITAQPQSQTVFANERVELVVGVDYTNPYNVAPVYQWFKNGTAIPFASGTTHVIPVVAAGDAGTYRVTAYLSGVEATSADAVLTVNADTKAPTITSVSSDDTFTGLVVRYSEPLTAAGTYTLSGGATVSGAVLSADKFSVAVATSALAPGTDYTLGVSGATDNAGNAVAANTTASFTTWVEVANQMRAYYYTGIGGTAVNNFTGNAKFPASPDDIRMLNSFSQTDGYGDNYGVMLRGYFQPTETGSYHFFIRSDDASQLFLNTTGQTPPNPLTSTPVAQETGCCNAFLEPGAAQTTAAPINLTAGQKYGFTVMMKEGGGGDYVFVAWRLSTDTTAANALPAISSEFFGTFAPPTPTAEPVNIAWVSFHPGDDTPSANAAAAGFTQAPDVGFTQLLRDAGHSVTRIVTSGTPDAAALNAYDLVIISRSVPSSDYQNANASNWNAIKRPMIIMGGYVLRNSRMGFTTGGTIPDTDREIKLNVADPNHPVFAGVALDGSGNMVNPYAGIVTFGTQLQRGISVNTDPLAGGGTLLATVGTVDDPAYQGMIVGEWQAGATMGNTAADVLGGHRLVLLAGSREQNITSEGAGIYDLGEDGAKILLNAVSYMAEPSVLVGTPVVADGNVTITFPAGAELETSTDLIDWNPTGNTSGSVTEAIGPGAKYFRARQD